MSFSWSTIEDLAFNLCLFFGFTIRAFRCIFFLNLCPNKIHNRPFVHEPGATWKHFNYIFFLVSFSWEYHWRPCIQLVPIFWFPIRAFPCIYFLDLWPSKSKNRPFLCMKHAATWKHFKYISFWWVYHGVPLKTLHSTCAYFFGSPLELLMHIFFWTFAK